MDKGITASISPDEKIAALEAENKRLKDQIEQLEEEVSMLNSDIDALKGDAVYWHDIAMEMKGD